MRKAHEQMAGPNHPQWDGGYNLYRGNWHRMRRVVRNRDCFRCRKCGMHEDECDTELHVHHIVSLREFDEPEEANSPSNLVTVCPSCHGQVEGDVEAGRALL
jgi:5-methylcytosine-specific restriction endonuclease McrA